MKGVKDTTEKTLAKAARELTAQDLVFADWILDAVRDKDRTKLAAVLKAVHDRAVVCALVKAEAERSAEKGKTKAAAKASAEADAYTRKKKP